MGRDRPVLFEGLVKGEGTFRLFSGLCTPTGKIGAMSRVRIFAFAYYPHAIEERFVPSYEAERNPQCAEFEQKLLESGRGGQALPGGTSARSGAAAATAA